MVIDTSAFLAILFREDEAERFLHAIDEATTRIISVASILEAEIVTRRRFAEGQRINIDGLITELQVDIWPIDNVQLRWARFAAEIYGRGRHAAGLNFGDCFSYALAKSTGEPLLFKGSDFSLTDIASAV